MRCLFVSLVLIGFIAGCHSAQSQQVPSDTADIHNADDVAKLLPSVRYVALFDLVDDATAKALAKRGQLKGVSVSSQRLTSEVVQRLASIEGLEDLWLKDCTGLDDKAAEAIVRNTTLRQLHVSGCTPADDAAISILMGSTTLHDLSLGNLSGLDDKSLGGMSDESELTKLYLVCDDRVTDAAFQHLAKAAKLESIQLGGPAVTDSGISKLKTLRTLKRLSICCPEVTGVFTKTLLSDSALEELEILAGQKFLLASVEFGKSARTLRTLMLPAEAIKPESRLEFLQAFQNLESLHLGHNVNLGGRIGTVLRKLPKLQHLVLHDSDITDEDLREIAQIGSLRVLHFYNCKGVTDNGVSSLAALTKLEVCHMVNCENVSEACALALSVALPKCSVLWGAG